MFPRSFIEDGWFLDSARLFDALASFSRSRKCCSLLARMSDFGAGSEGTINEVGVMVSAAIANGVDSLPIAALILADVDLLSSTSPSSTSFVDGLGVETPAELC